MLNGTRRTFPKVAQMVSLNRHTIQCVVPVLCVIDQASSMRMNIIQWDKQLTLWTEIQTLCLLCHLLHSKCYFHSDAWLWQHHAVGLLRCSRDCETIELREGIQSIRATQKHTVKNRLNNLHLWFYFWIILADC